MDGKIKAPVELAIAHVLFVDIVGYSKLRTAEQNAAVATLNDLVQSSEPFQIAEKADRLLKIPTGDGMALVFYSSPEEPVQCAVALSRLLKENGQFQVRMGIHSGSVSGVVDVTGRANVAGAGINITQRVMDCADAGHILISKHAADDLAEYERWRPLLHDLGSCEVKHGVKVHVVSLWSDDIGNSRVPSKLRSQRQRVRRKRWILLGTTIIVIGLAASATVLWRARQTALASTLRHSVAVLPFENLSANPDNAILAGGVHREVLTNLAKIADLKVISQTSVMRYKPGTNRDLKQIAQELGVAYVVEGSLQREANHILILAELIEVSTDSHVWAQKYDGEIADVLAFQSEIAQRISNQLGAKLSPRERNEVANKPTQDLAAFESYIRARALMESSLDEEEQHDRYFDDYTRAVQLLEQAVARDTQFAAAYWALVDANIQLFRTTDMAQPEYRTRAEAVLKEAQRVAPNAGETLLAQARVIYYGYLDFGKALTTLEQAATFLPNNAEITLTRGLLYRRFDRWQEAYAQFVRATELNPQDVLGYEGADMTARGLRWWSECDQMRELTVKRFPRRARLARFGKMLSLRLRGDVEAGNKELEELNPDVQTAFTPLFYRAMWKRDYEEARRLVKEAEKYPELEGERWEKGLQLVFVTKDRPSTQAAMEVEKRVEERLSQASTSPEEGDLTATLIAVKLMLGKNDEGVRLAEKSVERHPISEDLLANRDRLRILALAYVIAGKNERAIETFANLVKVPNGVWYGPMKYDPVLDTLRKDPRFQQMIEQARLPFPR
jgi:TolB-like protein/Flp pilus assembly protein TadD